MGVVGSSAVVQAIASAVAAGVTIALWRTTTRYANATDKMLDAMTLERADRIAAARAPATNAIDTIDDFIRRVNRTVENLDDESRAEAERRGDFFILRENGQGFANVTGQAAQVIAYAPLRNALNALGAEVVRLWQLLPQTPGQGQTPPTLGELRTRLPRIFEQIKRVREAQQMVRRETDLYTG
jgi:hypothetical protein